MADFVDREKFLTDKRKFYCSDCDRRMGMKKGKRVPVYEIGGAPCRACGIGDMLDEIEEYPAADVRPAAEISDAVDEVLDFLNENSNCMPYHIYSALFDLVSGICPNCGADMREAKIDG